MKQPILAFGSKTFYLHSDGEYYATKAVVAGVSQPVLERSVRGESLGAPSTAQSRRPSVRVCVTRFARRPLDDCNFSTKAIVDCVRFSGIVFDDNWGNLEVVGEQKKVARKEDEGTEIVVEKIA